MRTLRGRLDLCSINTATLGHRDCPEIGGIIINAIRRVGYVAGWGFADGMDAAIGWNGD